MKRFIMKLGDLAFACYIYSHISDYDKSYRRLVNETKPHLDPHSERHQMILLEWLNEWGCRQFAKEYHSLAAREIEEWYEGIGSQLFPPHKTLLSFTDNHFALAEYAYARLVNRTASYRELSDRGESRVEIGPTGAAKILFALCPDALPPWDDPIRAELGLDGSAPSYCTYLRDVRELLEDLSRACNEQGFSIDDLPEIIGRPESSLVKLIDEYFWVTISRRCPPPSDCDVMRWAKWR